MGIDSADIYANRGRWKMRRLSSIMAELGHTGVRNYNCIFRIFRTRILMKLFLMSSGTQWPVIVEISNFYSMTLLQSVVL